MECRKNYLLLYRIRDSLIGGKSPENMSHVCILMTRSGCTLQANPMVLIASNARIVQGFLQKIFEVLSGGKSPESDFCMWSASFVNMSCCVHKKRQVAAKLFNTAEQCQQSCYEIPKQQR